MCDDKEPLDALGAGAFFYSVLSSGERVFSSAGADCLERFGPSALHFPRGRQITNNEEEEMKKKMNIKGNSSQSQGDEIKITGDMLKDQLAKIKNKAKN